MRGPRFRCIFRDVYIGADIALKHYLWCQAAALYARPAALVSGLSVNRLTDAGWVIVRITANDVLRRPAEMVARILRLIEARSQDQNF